KPVNVPTPDVPAGRVDVQRKVEEVANGQPGPAVTARAGRGEHVQPLDNDDLGPLDGDDLIGNVVGQMRVDGSVDAFLARFDVDRDSQQRLAGIGFGDPLAVHDAAALEFGIGQEKTVGGDKLNPRMCRIAAQ